jgi:hypothetical protein
LELSENPKGIVLALMRVPLPPLLHGRKQHNGRSTCAKKTSHGQTGNQSRVELVNSFYDHLLSRNHSGECGEDEFKYIFDTL